MNHRIRQIDPGVVTTVGASSDPEPRNGEEGSAGLLGEEDQEDGSMSADLQAGGRVSSGSVNQTETNLVRAVRFGRPLN